jgi:aarF domain-containing kinase
MLDKVSNVAVALRMLQLMVYLLPMAFFFPLAYISDKWDEIWCRMLKRILERMGPCFIKLGQYGATRNDLLPARLCAVLSELHGNVTPHAYSYTCKIIEEDFGEPWQNVFSSLKAETLGSGSIAQVHEAVLKSTGEHVAVKVCHPKVQQRITRDYVCVQWLARLADPYVKWMCLPEQAAQFGLNLSLQIDLSKEAENLELFNQHFKETQKVRFPAPMKSTVRVLVESLEDCNPIEDYYYTKSGADKPPELRHEVAKLGVETYFQMIITDNLFHCDLHPGNMRFKEDPQGNSFVFLDTAICQSLTQQEQLTSVKMMLALMQKDGKGAAQALLDMDGTKVQKFCVSQEQFKAKMRQLVQSSLRPRLGSDKPWYVPELVAASFGYELEKYKDVAELLRGTLELVREYKVRIDPAYASLLFSTILLADMASKVDPDFDLLAHGSSWFFHSTLGSIQRQVL